jgi:hypothetical protein
MGYEYEPSYHNGTLGLRRTLRYARRLPRSARYTRIFGNGGEMSHSIAPLQQLAAATDGWALASWLDRCGEYGGHRYPEVLTTFVGGNGVS